MKYSSFILLLIILIQACALHKNTVRPPRDSQIITISSMPELEAHVYNDSLVLFDFDHTLFEGASVYGHANWFYDQVEEGKQRGISADQTIRRIFPAWLQSQERMRVKAVEPLTVDLIKRLQDRGIKVMGLTARQTPLIPATLRQLKELGVDFNRSSLMPAIFGANEFSAPVAYREGILFTSEFVKKSDVLKAYCDRISYLPKHIVFVDDSLKHVEDVVNTFGAMGIAVTGLHYPLVESNRSSWNKEQAAKIFEQCSKETDEQSAQCRN